ncbi:hypothetical protein BKA62DRAFT_674844 [Auriculariales sp. MPI-PUGE-AT-0066]|nr:hypothetical protein BKA62DRAFT_674844 [Auriculariales sp. MPI-PUGE-AT-0066]
MLINLENPLQLLRVRHSYYSKIADMLPLPSKPRDGYSSFMTSTVSSMLSEGLIALRDVTLLMSTIRAQKHLARSDAERMPTRPVIISTERAIQNALSKALLRIAKFNVPTAPVDKLASMPEAALVGIATHLDLTDRIEFARTCGSVRKAMLAHPELWNRVSIVDSSWSFVGPDAWQSQLDRLMCWSASQPVHLHTRMSVSLSSFRHWDIIEERAIMSRVVTLDVSFWPSIPYQFEQDPVYDARLQAVLHLHRDRMLRVFSQPAPLLETFAMYNSYPATNATLPANVFSGHASRLRRISLTGVLLLPEVRYDVLAGVTQFNIWGLWNRALDAMHLRTIFDAMPLLEQLAINFQSYDSSLDATIRPTIQPRHRPLRIGVSGVSSGLVELHNWIPGGATFSIFQDMQSAESNAQLQHLCSEGPLIVIVDYDILCAYRGGATMPFYTHIYGLGGSRQLEVLSNSLCDRIRCLTIHEKCWELFAEIPAVPQVEELTIVLGTCVEHRTGDPEGSVLSPGASGVHLKLPALLQVAFYSNTTFWVGIGKRGHCMVLSSSDPYQYVPPERCACDRGCVISLTDIVDFVRPLVQPGHKLKWLKFAGVDEVVDWDPALQLCRLLEIVEDIDACTLPPREVLETVQQGVYVTREKLEISSYVSEFFEGFGLQRKFGLPSYVEL